jgi:hypothetical protein
MKIERPYESAIGEAVAPIGMGMAAIGSHRASTVEEVRKRQLAAPPHTVSGRVKAERTIWGLISNITGGKVRS